MYLRRWKNPSGMMRSPPRPAPSGPLLLLLALLLGVSAPWSADAFEFKLPWNAGPSSPAAGAASKGKQQVNGGALAPGDTVAVVGASGNVGKLVALRLSDTYRVNGIVRDASSVEGFFGGREDKISLFEADLLEEMATASAGGEAGSGCPPSLLPALRDANAVVICTGTTAFPTKAWTKSGETGIAGDVLGALLESGFNVKDAISSLDERGLNTPNNVDAKSSRFVVGWWDDACRVAQKRAVMLSSVGVRRRDAMPFPILDACGVLTAKAAGEAAVAAAAKDGGYSYTIVRPGQLFGGPYDNNYYLGTIFELDKDAAARDVEVGRGDALLGDTLRSTLAEVTAQICEGDCARDMDFAVVNVKGETPTAEQVQERLQAL